MSETQGKSLGARMMALFVAMIISVLAIGMVNTHPTYARGRVNGCMRMNRQQLAAYQHVARQRMNSCKNHNSKAYKKASKAYARAARVRDVRYRAGR